MLALAFCALAQLDAAPLVVASEPLPRAPTVAAAIRNAHCAVLRIDAHPRGRVALVSRICLRPGESDVVEERGVVDLDAGRFRFVRAPFEEPWMSGNEACEGLSDDDSESAATDSVSRALRDPRRARCWFDGAGHADHALWDWRSRTVSTIGDVDDAKVHWSESGRFVALQRPTDAHWKVAVLDVESTVVDTRTLGAVREQRVVVNRFHGDIAEIEVAARWPTSCVVRTWSELLLDDVACSLAYGDRPVAVRSARVDFATSPPTVLRVGPSREVEW